MSFLCGLRRKLVPAVVRHLVAKRSSRKVSIMALPAPIHVERECEAVARAEMESEVCCLCQETLGEPRICDQQVEELHKLPCSHTFGSICIAQWLLHDSPNTDCPLCRRTMIHSSCGHVVQPHAAATAPQSLQYHEDLPDCCLRCRAETALMDVVSDELELKDMQENALRGLETLMPSFFHTHRRDSHDIQKRLATIRREKAEIQEKLWDDWIRRECLLRW